MTRETARERPRLSFLNQKHVNIFQMCITGGLGIPASNRERSPSSNALVCTEYIRVGSLSGYLSSGMFLCFNFFSYGPLFVLGTSTSFVF